MATKKDTTVDELVINTLTKAQYNTIETKSDTELYLVTDETIEISDVNGLQTKLNTIPSTTSSVISGSTSALTSGGAYTALSSKQDTLYQQPTTTTSSITLNKLNNFYSLNVSSATTITFNTSSITLTSNVVTFELRINMTAVSTITFPTNVQWLDDEAPDMSEIGVYYFVFRQVNNSGYWIANLQGKWSY